ncbi:MAG: sulfur carrier protein ThiS [Pirellulales bacterium]
MAAVAGSGQVAVTVNGESRFAAAGSSLHDLVEAVGCAGKPIAVEVDGCVVPRARHAEVRLAGGERIEIVTFVGGG